MAVRNLLQFRNLDLTRDINDRFTKLILPGLIDGGLVTPVPGQLKVELSPYKLISTDGMVVEETSATPTFSTPAGQSTVIAIKAHYLENAPPIVEPVALEESAYNALTDKDLYVVCAYVYPPAGSVQTLAADINYSSRQTVDKIGRSPFRGLLDNPTQLPASNNRAGDFYLVLDGPSGLPSLYTWQITVGGSQWVNLTDSTTIGANLATHRANGFSDEKHLTDDEKNAVAGTSGNPVSNINPLVDTLDPRIPTLSEKNALRGVGNKSGTSVAYTSSGSGPWVITVTSNSHGLSDGQLVTFSNGTSANANGSFTITLLSANTFSYSVIAGNPVNGTLNYTTSGVYGTPSATNPFVLTQYTLAMPAEIGFTVAPTLPLKLSTSDGPFYVGKGLAGSATQHFKLYSLDYQREYVNVAGDAVYIDGVYKDAALTLELNPSADADSLGFYSPSAAAPANGYVYFKIAGGVADSRCAILYGKKSNFDSYTTNMLSARSISSAQTSADAIETIQTIKGRLWDDPTPTVEQNINLRKTLVYAREYLAGTLFTDHVISDFSRLANVNEFSSDFVPNVGINYLYSFYNYNDYVTPGVKSAAAYTYNAGTATVSYSSSVQLGATAKAIAASAFEIFPGSSTIYFAAPHGFYTGLPVRLALVGSSSLPNPLVAGTQYFVIKADANYISLAASAADAMAGTKIVLTSAASGNFTITPVAVSIGHIFLDGDGKEYKVYSTGGSSIQIRDRLGNIPSSINTALTNNLSGSIVLDQNPRNINLSTYKNSVGRERIYIRKIEPLLNEYHPDTGQPAQKISDPVITQNLTENRVRLYGGFKNSGSAPLAKVIADSTAVTTGNYRISVTGFYSQLNLLADSSSTSGAISIYIDGVLQVGTLDLSVSSSVALGGNSGIKISSFVVAENLVDNYPHTIDLVIASNKSSFTLYGFELIRGDTTKIQILPGRAFAQADLQKTDSIQSISLTPLNQGRGGTVSRFVNRNLVLTSQTQTLTDFDGSNPPTGTATNGSTTFSVTTNPDKLVWFKPGDIVKLVTGNLEENTLYISSIVSNTVTFSTAISLTTSPQNAYLFHLASSTNSSNVQVDPTEEYARPYYSDYGVGLSGDFSTLTGVASDAIFTFDDGTTSIAGYQVSKTTTGINGVSDAVVLGVASRLTIRAVASRIDLILVNVANVPTASVTVDGCSSFTVNFGGGGIRRIPLIFNGRYQTHEIIISNANGLALSQVILHKPAFANAPNGALLSEQNLIASHIWTEKGVGSLLPTGAVGIDPFVGGGVFVNGGAGSTPWANSIDFTENYWTGRYLRTNLLNGYMEYIFCGTGFELEFIAANDRGRLRVTLDGLVATFANFPSALFNDGIDETVGRVDMYNLTKVRKKFSIQNLTPGVHKLKLQILDKNVASSDYFFVPIAISEFGTYNSYTPVVTGGFMAGLNFIKDTRNFKTVQVF